MSYQGEQTWDARRILPLPLVPIQIPIPILDVGNTILFECAAAAGPQGQLLFKLIRENLRRRCHAARWSWRVLAPIIVSATL